MQQPRPMLSPIHPQFPTANITTEQIQSFLDENKKLILAILDNQNLGKLAECAQYQAKLQQNLMYLAAIADAQPQASVPPQMPPHTALQQAGAFMQHPQVTAAQQQMFVQKMPMQFNQQQMQEQQHLQHQHPSSLLQAQMGMRPSPSNGVHAFHAEGLSATSDARGNKDGGPLADAGNGDNGRGGSSAGPGRVNGETSFAKGSDEGAN